MKIEFYYIGTGEVITDDDELLVMNNLVWRFEKSIVAHELSNKYDFIDSCEGIGWRVIGNG